MYAQQPFKQLFCTQQIWIGPNYVIRLVAPHSAVSSSWFINS